MQMMQMISNPMCCTLGIQEHSAAAKTATRVGSPVTAVSHNLGLSRGAIKVANGGKSAPGYFILTIILIQILHIILTCALPSATTGSSTLPPLAMVSRMLLSSSASRSARGRWRDTPYVLSQITARVWGA